MWNWIFGRNSYSESKKRKLAEMSDGTSSSASLQDSEAKCSRKDVQQVNDSLDRLGMQSDVPTMQILFFHGLPLEDVSNVHLATWDNGDGLIWPQAWLLEKFPGAQIYFVKYGAALENSKVFNLNNIGENLISDLLQANIGQVQDCPVILVGHCVGGLVIKELCWKAHEELHSSDTLMHDRAKKLEAFLHRVRGIFYYSTPHHGIREMPKGYRFRFNAIFKYFETLSTDTSVLNSNFSKLCKRYGKWKIEGVGESLPVKLGVFQNVLVVPEASARDGVQIFNVLKEEDHFSMCKPKTITSGGFYHLTRLLGDIAEEETKFHITRPKNIEIELKAEFCPENFQIISKAVVGIQIPLQELKEKLKDISTLGLTGMGGSGKTTLAKAAFNELGCGFEYTCFVPDVKLIKGTVEKVKKEIWKHVYCKGKKLTGEVCWFQLRGKRLLLVLDDIADVRDTKVLSEIADGPSLESRFIATSRNDDLFEFFYKVPRLDETNHDRELFMSYAFPNSESPSLQLSSFTEDIVKKCEGLPLTLEVLGQWLRKTKDAEVWKQTLKAMDEAELVTTFNERLWAKLRPSIDGLQKNEKQMFLDASTFFCNDLWTLREAKEAWRVAYNGVSDVLWKILVDRSLVYDVDDDDNVKVHEQLRSLGRKIADESKANIDIRTLEDFELLQSANELERKNIRSLRIKVDRPYGEENHLRQSTVDDRDLEQISFEDGKIHIARLGLQELKELRYLDVNNQGEIDGAEEEILFPRRLVLLRCVGLNTLSLAQQRRLVVLRISGVTSLPNSFGHLSALRIFTLSDCENLRTLPNSFGGLSALERMLFDDCAIETLPESFGKLSALKYLKVKDCKSLRSLPESFGLLGALSYLNLHSLHNMELESLPNTFGHLSALTQLDIVWCSLLSLPESFGKLSTLKYLRFTLVPLWSLPDSFGLLGALLHLEFNICRMKSLPSTIGHLSALSLLEFHSCSYLESLPESFGKLSALKYLKFRFCDRLRSLPESFGLLGALVDLKFEYCDQLESLPNPFGDLSALSQLELTECRSLLNLPESLGNLPVLRHLKLSSSHVLHNLPKSLGRLAKLEHLEIDSLEKLKRLPESVAELGSLRHLAISKLCSLNSIPDYVQNLPSLRTLELSVLPRVKKLPPWLGETGVNWSGLSRKVFRIQDCQFSLTRDETVIMPFDLVGRIHSRLKEKVGTSDYEGAMADLDVSSFGTPEIDGFLLQEKGIIKRMMGDLHGALEDLTAALECFSNVDNGDHYSYDSWKHRGYVKFLMEDMEGADNDGTMALKLQLDYRGRLLPAYWFSSLGDEVVEYMHFRLGRLQAMEEHEDLLDSTHDEVLQKVNVADFQGALASFDVINVLLLRKEKRAFFLQERGVLKRLAGDLDGALEDLKAALEILGDDYDCLKHGGYVKYLLGDLDGASSDAERCLQVGLPNYYPGAQHLALASVAFMEYNLE